MAGIPHDTCHLDSAAFSRFCLKLSLSGYNVLDPYSLGSRGEWWVVIYTAC